MSQKCIELPSGRQPSVRLLPLRETIILVRAPQMTPKPEGYCERPFTITRKNNQMHKMSKTFTNAMYLKFTLKHKHLNIQFN